MDGVWQRVERTWSSLQTAGRQISLRFPLCFWGVAEGSELPVTHVVMAEGEHYTQKQRHKPFETLDDIPQLLLSVVEKLHWSKGATESKSRFLGSYSSYSWHCLYKSHDRSQKCSLKLNHRHFICNAYITIQKGTQFVCNISTSRNSTNIGTLLVQKGLEHILILGERSHSALRFIVLSSLLFWVPGRPWHSHDCPFNLVYINCCYSLNRSTIRLHQFVTY